MNLSIPELSLVVLIGPSGSGKSTFARKHFKATEVLTSDHCRALVSDDENDQTGTAAAFEVLHFIAAKRLAAGRLGERQRSVPGVRNSDPGRAAAAVERPGNRSAQVPAAVKSRIVCESLRGAALDGRNPPVFKTAMQKIESAQQGKVG